MKTIYHIVILFFTMSSFSQNEAKITLNNVEQVITIAIAENPDLNVYLLKQEKATVNYKKDKNHFLPNITGSFGFQNNLALQTSALPGEIFGQPGETVNVQLGQQYNYNAGINLSKTILNAENNVKAKISKVSADIAEAQTEAFKQSLKEQAAFYYYSTLISKHAVDISKEDLKISDSIYALTKGKFEQGLIDKTIENQARISRNNVQQNVLSNETIYQQSLNNLKLLLGLDQNSNIVLTEDILSSTHTIITQINPDKNLNVFSLQKEQSELEVKQGKAAFLPSLSLNGYFGKQQLKDDIGISFSENSWSNYSFINVSASIPIFSGFSKKNKLKIAKIENDITIQNLEIETKKSSIKDAQLLDEYARNFTILEHSKDSYMLTKDNANLALLKYEQGLMSLDAYFKSYEDYLKAENNYLNTMSSTFTQYATLLSRQQ